MHVPHDHTPSIKSPASKNANRSTPSKYSFIKYAKEIDILRFFIKFNSDTD